jgi:hypothetical protein
MLKNTLTNIYVLILLFTVNISFGQKNEEIPNLMPYEDLSSKLFISRVIEVKEKKSQDLITVFKNVASVNFVNLKEVIVSESENQITIVFINKCNRPYYNTLIGKIPWPIQFYVRLVVQFKDEKLRIQFFDDGNVYYQAMHQGDQSIPARNIFISAFQDKPKTIKELHKITGKNGAYGVFYDQHYEWQMNIISLLNSFEEGIKKNSTNSTKNDFIF